LKEEDDEEEEEEEEEEKQEKQEKEEAVVMVISFAINRNMDKKTRLFWGKTVAGKWCVLYMHLIMTLSQKTSWTPTLL
jgi:hypothetical protein